MVNISIDRKLHRGISFPLFLLVSLMLLSCEFRDPGEGYDGDWRPDHETTQGEGNDAEDNTEGSRATGSLPDEGEALPYKRPTDIAADTAAMQATDGKWSEMNGTVKTDYRVYRSGGKIAMIVEKTDNSTRSYYYNDGTLFYYNEQADDGSFELTVEFDDFGDVRGARKTVGGERSYTDQEEFAAIVEHAVELRLANEEGTE